MRKHIAFILAFLCLFTLASCGRGRLDSDKNINYAEGAPPPDCPGDPLEYAPGGGEDGAQGKLPGGEDGDAVSDLSAPPTLTVESDGQTIEAACSNYTWIKAEENGDSISVIACGAHPLESACFEVMPKLDIISYYITEKGEGQAFFTFGAPQPESVTVRRWSASFVGDCSAPAEEVSFENGTLSLGSGSYVYEVHADFGSQGSADYAFAAGYSEFCRLPLASDSD